MPTFFPEANAARPSDDELRSLAKYCQILYDSEGEKASPFPEGCAPKPGDDADRLWKKINILRGT